MDNISLIKLQMFLKTLADFNTTLSSQEAYYFEVDEYAKNELDSMINNYKDEPNFNLVHLNHVDWREYILNSIKNWFTSGMKAYIHHRFTPEYITDGHFDVQKCELARNESEEKMKDLNDENQFIYQVFLNLLENYIDNRHVAVFEFQGISYICSGQEYFLDFGDKILKFSFELTD